jgi:hypothetical protein
MVVTIAIVEFDVYKANPREIRSLAELTAS